MARLIGSGPGYYHCVSRVVGRQFVLEEKEKRMFRLLMRKLESFCGVQVVTYCVMADHFHVLLRIPGEGEALPENDNELLERIEKLYGKPHAREVRGELDHFVRTGDKKAAEKLRQQYTQRMGRLAPFMKNLLQRFTQSYNREHGRRGTLWEDRYKSVLVEGAPEALMTMAAYIDLNPVRAGLVENPADYPYCGYAEAAGGKTEARRGLAEAVDPGSAAEERYADWRRVRPEYEELLFGGDEKNNRGGKQPGVPEMLRRRVRYFTDGAIFGSEAFVESVFEANRSRYGPKRKSGARKMSGADWGGLRVLRSLQKDVFGKPASGKKKL